MKSSRYYPGISPAVAGIDEKVRLQNRLRKKLLEISPEILELGNVDKDKNMAVAERWKGYKELPKDTIDKLNELKGFWQENKDIILVYLFGSLLEKKNPNDIDLAILFNVKPPYERITELLEKLYKLTGTQRIDIVDLNRAGAVFKFNIISSGKLLYMNDVEAVNSFELRVIKEHMDTEYLRKVQKWFLREKALKND